MARSESGVEELEAACHSEGIGPYRCVREEAEQIDRRREAHWNVGVYEHVDDIDEALLSLGVDCPE